MAWITEAWAAFITLIGQDPGAVIYGVTSGYGQLANLRFTPEQRRAHAARSPAAAAPAFGDPLPNRVTRGIVFAWLTNFIGGHSAITTGLADAVAAMSGPERSSLRS